MEPKDRIALITGGGARVGQAISLGLARTGAHVIIHYNRSSGPAQETVAKAQGLGVEAIAHQANLAVAEEAQALAEAAMERFGRVDILVHAASPFLQAGLFDVTLETWRMTQSVLVESFLLLAQHVTPGMIAREEGVLIPILDRGAFEPWPSFLAHCVGKSALWALARSLSVALAPHVRVNGVVPGPVLPPPDSTEETITRIARSTLAGHWGKPEDVVDAVLYLVRSSYVTGEVLFVDGGQRWAHRMAS